MSAGYGMKGHIGFAFEASGGVPVAVTDYIEALSESLTADLDRFQTINIHGRLSEADDKDGVKRVAGDAVFAAQPDPLGFFLLGTLGVDSVTTVLSGFLHTHEFTPRTSDWDQRFPQHPFTFEVFRDVGSSQQYTGINMSQIQLNVAPNQDLRATVSMIGFDVDPGIAATTPSFVNSPACELAFDTASLSVAGAANAEYESFTLTFNNNLEGVPTLNNSTVIRKIRRTDMQMVRVSADIGFENITELQNFLSQSEQAIKLSLTRADSFQVIFDIPRVVWTAHPTGIGGRGRQIVTLDGMGRFHTGSNNALKITLTTVKSFYAANS